MQWIGWIFACDHEGCENSLTTTSEELVDALIFVVRVGWMPARQITGRQQRIFCPDHAADAKASTR